MACKSMPFSTCYQPSVAVATWILGKPASAFTDLQEAAGASDIVSGCKWRVAMRNTTGIPPLIAGLKVTGHPLQLVGF